MRRLRGDIGVGVPLEREDVDRDGGGGDETEGQVPSIRETLDEEL